MAGVTRRGFIYTTGAAAAGLASAGVAGGALSAALGTAGPALAEGAGANADTRMVAYVREGSSGEITVMVGDRHVTYHDPQLVRRLQKAIA